jgi:sensitive to high expression protein 9, mitochondrial
MDNLQSNIFLASQRLNDLTGYSGIEALKQRITTLEAHLSQCQETVRSARETYKQAVADRAASQREVTTLLARKDAWTPADLERFTSLYRSDHSNEAAVQEAQQKLGDAERMVEQASNKLSTSILARYHEEQIWSDKIRRMSTWGTWGLMGVNVVIFLVFQFGFEPWRRRRLVRGFEEKVQEALRREKESLALAREEGEMDQEGLKRRSEEDGARLGALVASGMEELESECDDSPESDAPAVGAVAAVISNDAKESIEAETAPKSSPQFGLDVHKWKSGVLDLFSDQITSLRKKDVTIIALEGAATGAGIVGLIMLVIRPH